MTHPATYDHDLASHSERPDSILQFWKAIELFSPQKIPRIDPNSRTNPTFRVGGRTPIPWDSSKWFQEAAPGKEWRFTVYCGVYKQSRVRSILERHFGRSPADFDERSEGESCLFAVQITAEGRVLLDTFTLASCAWAAGRLENPGPKSTGCFDGFEATAKEFSLSFAERFAVLENDEVGRNLNSRPGVHVSRPVQSDDLSSEAAHSAKLLNVVTLDPKEVRISARQIAKDSALDADSDDFLNSFLLSDLARLAQEATHNNLGGPLSLYLMPERSLKITERRDARSFDPLWQNTAPQLFPLGRWPTSSRQSLYIGQQFAANSAFEEFKNGSVLFGVNGPPGTGKTTLLREIIANVVVQRAQALSELKHPKDAFVGPPIEWQSSKYKGKVYPWRKSLTGHGIVVASSNNRAVENITLEIPAAEAISTSNFSEIDYYGDFASRILQQRDSPSKQGKADAWGLIAARLGKKKNRQSFVGSFWFANKSLGKPPQLRAEQGFLQYLTGVTAKPDSWQNAVKRFKEAVERESTIRGDRVRAWYSIAAQSLLIKQIAALEAERRGAEVSLAQIQEDLLSAIQLEQNRKKLLDEALDARKQHLAFKPTLVDVLFTFGKAYQEWRTHDLLLSAQVEAQRAEYEILRMKYHELATKRESAKSRIEKLTVDYNRAEIDLMQQRAGQIAEREKLGSAYPSVERWLSHPEERELSSPWADESWNEARTNVFIEALHLHRTFVECVPKQIKTNVGAAMDILLGKVSAHVQPEGLRAAWESFFFVIPVVSTTFASFDRLFAHLGRESIGWLLIDEAGQAVPQAAAGALWRSRRAIAVGDPRQLQPIVTLPFTAQQALRSYFHVEETWLPSKNSVQTLADRVSQLGSWLKNNEDEKHTWVGSPLRVHRRCENPMFAISNEIAYDGQMVYATQEVASSLPKTKWIDIKSPESDDHWIPAEGLMLEILLGKLFASGLTGTEILLISPFRAVAGRLREIGQKWGISGAGTIHVSQGRESEVVVLVLGGDPRKPGAKDWASEKPNLLNVAVSRAKRRLFVIGDREQWKEYRFFGDAASFIAQHGTITDKAATLPDGAPPLFRRTAEA